MSGERKGDREVIERNTKDLINSGIEANRARRMAEDSMRRVDRKLQDQGRR